MKKIILAICIVACIAKSNAQDAKVEKSVYGVQLGIIGLWAHNEARLTNSIALRSELGIELGFYDNNFTNDTGVFGGLSIILEPRWYYNLERRTSKNKRIDGNSGNFISLHTRYHPDVVLFSGDENLNIISDIAFIPTYGIRRSFGKHFNYEAAFGFGYIHYLEDNNTIFEEADIGVNLNFKIGYRF